MYSPFLTESITYGDNRCFVLLLNRSSLLMLISTLCFFFVEYTEMKFDIIYKAEDLCRRDEPDYHYHKFNFIYFFHMLTRYSYVLTYLV